MGGLPGIRFREKVAHLLPDRFERIHRVCEVALRLCRKFRCGHMCAVVRGLLPLGRFHLHLPFHEKEPRHHGKAHGPTAAPPPDTKKAALHRRPLTHFSQYATLLL